MFTSTGMLHRLQSALYAQPDIYSSSEALFTAQQPSTPAVACVQPACTPWVPAEAEELPDADALSGVP